MKLRTILLFSAVVVSQAFADPHAGDEGARNKDGSIVTGVLTAQFDPSNLILPFPSNLLFIAPTQTTDLTLSAPDQLSTVDGFSTTEKWVATFADTQGNPGSIDPTSVEAGKSVRVFEVESVPPWVAVTGIRRELTPGLEYGVGVSGNVVAIVPTVPLKEYTTYMAVLTNDIRDTAGNNATPDQTYHLSKRRTPWVDENDQSTYPLVDDATANALEPLRQITLSMEFAASTEGVNPDDIILAWTVQTQSISTPTRLLRSIAEPAPVLAGPTGFDTSLLGAPGIADIVVGIITLPYYLEAPSAENPLAPLTESWKAAPGAYVPPFDQFGLDPTSTNLTQANPWPVPTGTQTVPFIMTVPNEKSGQTKPAEGWPVVIYMHGLSRNRTDMLALADSLALAGFAVISLDQPTHGVVPAVDPQLAPFWIENHPVFGPLANERTFESDYFNNETGAPGKDDIPDASGTIAQSSILLNPVVTRDIGRQATVDLSVLALSLQNISVDGDATPDLNPFNVGALFHSLGTTVGIPFLAIEGDGLVSRAYINAATGALLRTGLASSFGDAFKAGLASVGIIEGTPQFELTITVLQTALDPGDGVNYATEAAMKMPIIHNQVQGDETVANFVPGEPLAGSEAINRLMGLQDYSDALLDQNGLRGVARYLPPAFHESLFRPVSDDPPFTEAPEVTIEMQGQAASFMFSGGTFVNVGTPDLLVPVISSEILFPGQPGDTGLGKKKKQPGWGEGLRLDRFERPIKDRRGRQ